ncbi:MAG: DUF5916 domain-containing protein [Candidatus Poribacteria bacterium]|nr:DUF5916 domain-containing protein [Candidatus Poribacteria bacterium]
MTIEWNLRKIWMFLFVFFTLQFTGTIKAETETESAHRVATAVRIKGAPPQLDGVLDDDIWKTAPLHEGFRQRDPDEGEPASQRTTFQVVYDDEALYFGIMCYDNEPDKIVSRLVRRDNYVESDKIHINLDPHYNRQRAFWFTAYPSGSVTDGIAADSGWWNSTWDGVWEVKTQIHENGWAAEYKIPFHVLRFSPKAEYTWGLQVTRDISRKKENAHWRLIKRDEPGWVSRFGDLVGIKDIHPSRHLEVLPYAMGRTILNRETNLWGNIGADVQYGITTGTTLNATINPDFGQVEADPATLNLSAYEEFFRERRPFFVKGASIFGNNDYSFFYSRRIGRQPGHFDLPEGADELNRPEATTILGAAKVVGRTQGGTSFGIMEAVTAPEYAQIEKSVDEQRTQSDHLIEPLTNYFVGRINQDVLKGNSQIGLITTAVNRRSSNAAYVGGLDWDLKFAEERYQITGTLAASQAGKLDARKSGYLAHLEFDKRGGWLRFDTDLSVLSPDFEINDLGYHRRSDMLEWNYDLTVRKEKPFSIFRRVVLGLYGWRHWNYDGVSISRYSEIWTDGRLKNYWDYDLWIGRNLESFSDDDVRRGGALIKSPAGWWIFTNLTTDSRKMIRLQLNPVFAWNDDKRSYDYDVDVNLRIRPASNIEFSIGPSYAYQVKDAQWVELIEENINGKIKNHYVYGELTTRTLDFTTRANISFTPTLSLQFYVQPFITIGDYTNFKELIEPKSYQFKPYPLKGNRDFHRRSLRGNTVLRWEFQPGSTLFLVWSQSREAALESVREADLDFRPLHRLGSTFTDEGKNIFLIKCRYWFGM